MILNTLIISSTILYGDATLIIYSLMCNVICSKFTDIVIVGMNKYYIVRIMSDNYLEVTDFICKKLLRRVTFIQGMDTANVKKKMLLETIVSKRDLIRLKEYVKSLKDDSFVYAIDSAGIRGRDFREV